MKAAFIKMCSKKNELSFFEDLANFCKDMGLKYYHTYSETEVAFGERATRTLKN